MPQHLTWLAVIYVLNTITHDGWHLCLPLQWTTTQASANSQYLTIIHLCNGIRLLSSGIPMLTD